MLDQVKGEMNSIKQQLNLKIKLKTYIFVSVRVSSGLSGFLLPPKIMSIGGTGNSKLLLCVNACVHDALQ